MQHDCIYHTSCMMFHILVSEKDVEFPYFADLLAFLCNNLFQSHVFQGWC